MAEKNKVKIKKMSRRIFLSMFIVSALVLLVSTSVTVAIIYQSFSRQNVKALESEISSIRNGVRLNGTDYLETLKMNHRVTLINKEGTVIFDNRVNPGQMENHNERDEVIEAREKGEGYSERYSNTLSEKTIYIAVLMKNGEVLRVSENFDTVWNIFSEILLPMFILLITAIILAAFISFKTSGAITKPINDINLINPKKEDVYAEIEPLVDKIVQQNKQIEHQVQELKREHQRQDDLRRDFTANVSHELKTPLTSISGFAEIIQNGLVKDEDIERFAGKIHKESQRLIILVGDIIKLSQLDGKDIAVKIEPIDLYETSQAVMSHLEDAAERKNVTLELQGSRAVIMGAEQIIEEMIFNLVDNAIKYNVDGGSVTVRIEREEEKIKLSVADNGIGIPKEDQERIFERFYRVDKSHSKDIGGTGLGLSIVKHGANFHKAALSVSSEPGKGTIITLIF